MKQEAWTIFKVNNLEKKNKGQKAQNQMRSKLSNQILLVHKRAKFCLSSGLLGFLYLYYFNRYEKPEGV